MEAPSTGEKSAMDTPVPATVPEADVRQGSPFAAGTGTRAPAERRLDLDAGAAGIAWGGVWAAWLILPFAVATAWSFPLGGMMIAGLGEALSVAGLTSPKPRWAVAALVIHGALLAISLIQLL